MVNFFQNGTPPREERPGDIVPHTPGDVIYASEDGLIRVFIDPASDSAVYTYTSDEGETVLIPAHYDGMGGESYVIDCNGCDEQVTIACDYHIVVCRNCRTRYYPSLAPNGDLDYTSKKPISHERFQREYLNHWGPHE